MEENKTLISDNQFQIIQSCELSNSWVNCLDNQLKTKAHWKETGRLHHFLFLELETAVILNIL